MVIQVSLYSYVDASSLLLCIGCLSALLIGHINLRLFETTVLLKSIPPTSVTEVAPLTADEMNALRYSAGYVPFSLKKKLKQRPEFAKWLECMAVDGEGSSYLDYSKEWIKAVNRGGLFQVNDKTFEFFVDLEMRVRKHLPNMLKPNSKSMKKEVMEDLTGNDDVRHRWMAVTSDFEDESLSSELLWHVVELWLTIRGFSEAGAWMEYYKQCKESGLKRDKALRKGLKRKRLEMEDSNDENLFPHIPT